MKTIVPENPWLQETGNPFVTIISPNGWSTKPAALISLLNGYRRRWEFGGWIFCTISSVGSSTRRYNWSIVIVEVKWSTSTRSAASSVVSVKRVHCIDLTTVVCTSVIQKQVEITVCDEGITRQSSRHEARYYAHVWHPSRWPVNHAWRPTKTADTRLKEYWWKVQCSSDMMFALLGPMLASRWSWRNAEKKRYPPWLIDISLQTQTV